ALRDGCTTDSPSLEARRARFDEDVLAPLERASIARDGLITAWDFRTASGPSAWGDLREMRDVALAALDAGELGCVVDADVEVEHEGQTFRRVEGHVDVPLFLASLDAGARLERGADGAPIAAASAPLPFLATWPTSIESGTGAPTMMFGHGLFSTRNELDEEPGRQLLARGRMVGIATDLIGLAQDDLGAAAGALMELSQFSAVLDRLTQGIVAMLVLPRLFATRCAELLGIEGAIDPSALVYTGNSQGAIVGPTLAALSPDIERYALGVGGIGYSVMMPRSLGFETVESILFGAYPRRVDRDLLMVMFQHHWDRFEGAAFAPHVHDDRLAASIERPARILYQVGLEDAETPNVASEIAARTMGLGVLSSSASQPWGTEHAGDAPGSAYVAFDYDAAPLSDAPVRPTVDSGVHERVRRDPVAQEQIMRFFREGVIAP
nr:hypothetical protein [Myxococcota bacterium]